MRKGVLTAEITLGDGSVMRLASRMYSDGNTLYRGHIDGFSQMRQMSDALAGRTSMSIADVLIHNEHEEYDSTLISGSVDIRIGSDNEAFASMDAVMLDATIGLVSRTDNEISVAVLDGQNRGNTKQQRLFDTSGVGFGTLLPEPWGVCDSFPFVNIDAAGLVYACAGPLIALGNIYANDVKLTGGVTASLVRGTAVLTFTAKPDGVVTADVTGLGSTLPGALLETLLTRVTALCQGQPISSASTTITLDERIDDALATLVGETIYIFRTTFVTDTRTITAFDSATRIATVSVAWSTNPTVDDIYSIEVDTAAGGFTTAQVDSTGFDALDVLYPYDFGLVATDGINAISMQDEMLGPLLCHLGPKRDGIVHLKRLEVPVSPAVSSITRIIGEIQRMPMPVYWSVEARYRIDNTGGHWRSVSAFDASIKSDHPEAKTLTIDVPVQDRDGAELIAQHWLTCFGAPTELATMTVDHNLSELDLGDVVEVTDSRYQFKNGQYASVVGMTDVFDGYDELVIWVKSQ